MRTRNKFKLIQDKKVAVLMGGPSSERDISLRSGKAVLEALREANLKVKAIEVDEKIKERLKKEKIDIAFLALHGKFGEDGTIQELLERLDIVYTGSGVEASRIAFDKVASKEFFQRNNIATPNFFVLKKGERGKKVPKELVVVKPAREGSAIGVSLARGRKECLSALKKAFQYDERVLVEEYIDGREVTVGILNGSPLPIVEILPPNGIFDFDAKYTKGLTDFRVPADLPRALYRETQDLGFRAHRALGCRGMSRVDMKVSSLGKPYVLEVNTIPGMTSLSIFPKAALAAGISFPRLCCQLIEIALRSHDLEREQEKGSSYGRE